jgi:hypothetical protein
MTRTGEDEDELDRMGVFILDGVCFPFEGVLARG